MMGVLTPDRAADTPARARFDFAGLGHVQLCRGRNVFQFRQLGTGALRTYDTAQPERPESSPVRSREDDGT